MTSQYHIIIIIIYMNIHVTITCFLAQGGDTIPVHVQQSTTHATPVVGSAMAADTLGVTPEVAVVAYRVVALEMGEALEVDA